MDCLPQQPFVVGRPVLDRWGRSKGLEVPIGQLQRGGDAMIAWILNWFRLGNRKVNEEWRYVAEPPNIACRRWGQDYL